ncbi:uncharacterized protein LOC113520129 isoform X1 [Galleria mellonella]|uniref:Uncharacterized protein LOC113520129 isoform X1 n=1 Tax=Galleria mellonella TaxID=7137 RepID=A0ABM3MER4_GALME|nr:uncharacterized protein LOC113520129 isoform X1 [Galleria mellonella]
MHTLLIILFTAKIALAQISGEFWWLNDRVSKLKGKEAPLPQFEDVSEFDTDESDKIVFRDNFNDSWKPAIETVNYKNETKNEKWKIDSNFQHENKIFWPSDDKLIKNLKLNKTDLTVEMVKYKNETKNEKWKIDGNFQHENKIFWPSDNKLIKNLKLNKTDLTVNMVKYKNESKNEKWKIDNNFQYANKIFWPTDDKHNKRLKVNKTDLTVSNESKIKSDDDEFNFQFPEDDSTWKNIIDEKKTSLVFKPNKTPTLNIFQDYIDINTFKNKVPYSENICTYMKKNECYQRNGFVYKQNKDQNFRTANELQYICCILPLNEDSSKITFPDSSLKLHKQNKRSANNYVNTALGQRNFLLQRKYTILSSNIKKNEQKTKITDEDYEDPYWNIKNIRPKIPNTSIKPVNLNKDCHIEDYVEDYIVELPKPGLFGIYSDHRRPSGWTDQNKRPSYGETVDEYEYDDEPGGYSSTIDPRRGNTSKLPNRGRPLKMSTPNEPEYRPESQTVSYTSNPDFQVLQGFKLLNLARNKNKFYLNNPRKSTTESFVEKISGESLIIDSNADNGNPDFIERQKFKNCGKVLISPKDLNEKQIGNAENGSHPWLAFVVRSKQRQGILCYATIIHPRAAITTADCVYGYIFYQTRINPGDITVVTGVWDLKDRSQSQSRTTASIIHPQYKVNDLNHNMAIIHWNRPLRLGVNVQPACLGDVSTGEDCKLYGWGGYDQAIHSRSRWQRASILTTQECRARLSSLSDKRRVNLSNEVFCASVQARGTVTGIGGPLICSVEDRYTLVGVAAWRDTILVMLPAYEWAIPTLETLYD